MSRLPGLRNAGIDASHVTFVTVDFVSEGWMTSLRSAGFDPSLPTLLLLEGVAYYLLDEVVDITMRHIADCTCARLVYDVYDEASWQIGDSGGSYPIP